MSYNFEVVYGLPLLNPIYGGYFGVACNGNGKIMFAVEVSETTKNVLTFRVWRSEDFGVVWKCVFSEIVQIDFPL